MAKIVGAMDMSGNTKVGHKAFLAIVIGTHEYIQSIVNSTGYEHIHMRSMRKKDQERVISRLNFNNTECIVLCVRINRTAIIDRIIQTKRRKKHPIIPRKILQAYNRVVLEKIRDRLDGFLSKHGASLSEVMFECESDCIDFAKDTGLRYKHVKSGGEIMAHILADISSWLNTNERKLENVIEMNIADEIWTRLEKDLLK